ncbi:hypothetical protein [Haloferula sargassicola]|uniref:Uncharacterized protein n=1 Tax=Haloferula sargassicola TaxID=490096 RepID=A0ABP9UQK4_9BACT
MRPTPTQPGRAAPLLVWVAALAAATSQCRPLFMAWLHDPTMRGSGWVFLLWLPAVASLWRWPAKMPWAWILGAFALLFLGILGEMQALIYGGLSLLLCLPVPKLGARLGFAATSAAWMPLWYWALRPLAGPSIALWTLVGSAALLGGLLVFTHLTLRHEPKEESHPV